MMYAAFKPAAPVFLLVLLAAACASGEDTTLVTATLSLETPQPITDAQDGQFRKDGLYDLQTYEAYAAVVVSSNGQLQQHVAWPEDGQATAAAGEEDTVTFEIAVTPGVTLDVTAVAFIYGADGTTTWVPVQSSSVFPKEAEVTPMNLLLVPAGTGTVRGSTPPGATAVWLIDLGEMVKLAQVPVNDDSYEFLQAPLSRDLILATVAADDTTIIHSETTFRLDTPAQILQLDMPDG